jgi:eukaryotic-like serine/threonine-protein kinase
VTMRTALRGSLPYAVAIIGGFLLAYLIVAFFVFPSGVIPRDAKVPNVTGLLFDDAVKRLAERGFKGQRGEQRFHAASPKETVLEQSPAAGTRDVEGAAVTLAVSAGQQLGSVPAVIGVTREQAESALEGAGFEVGEIVERPNDAPRGQVIDSRPKPGTQAPTPSAVSLVVSAGQNVVLVPNIVGKSVAEARDILRRAGLALGDVNSAFAGNLDMATVTSQSPPAGAQVASATRISVVAGGTASGEQTP